MAERSWTKPQQDAIDARGGTLLVSAAAGSGKTAVLVERVLGIICDAQNPVDVDRLLIVTFSIAAAAEMRQRIGARLTALIREEPGNLHLQRQQALLQKAQISTIHAFCLNLIRENFQHLSISQDFSIADTNELELMKSDCIADCVEKFYAEDTSGLFAELVELLSSGRDDSRLVQTVYQIYEFSRSHPYYEDWLDEKAALYGADLPVSETIWGEEILRYAGDSLEHCKGLAAEGLRILYDADEKLQKAYLPAFEADFHLLTECVKLAHDWQWDALVSRLRAYDFGRLGAVRGEDPQKEHLKDTRKRIKDTLQALRDKYLCAEEAEAKADIEDLHPKIRVLFALVKEFGWELQRRKTEKRRLDFSDLEHLALQLLVEKADSQYRRTAHAAVVQEQYDYVLVDEYQDTNEVQDLIFTSVSRGQENLFMVGDVKQSIYSFRQAMPEIFMRKKEVFFPYDTGLFPASISLDTNFRSRREVTEATNFIFGKVMTARMGEIEYDEKESLKCGARYEPYDKASPELLLLGLQGQEADGVELEAAAVAGRIKALLDEGYQVSGRDGMRPATPRDFCILLRSPKNRARQYVKALEQLGIGAWAENAGGYLQTREIAMVVSLLKALDNPLLDIELVAAMLSPLFGFTDDDIAEIRLTARGVPFFSALSAAAEAGSPKAGDFLALFAELRRDADFLPADRLLLRIYEKTNALGIARVMPLGESRHANLLLLVEYATQYHSMGYKRLAGFVGFLSRLEAKGGDLYTASTLSDGADVVRIQSIHRSKGLEYPIVILADTAKQFNMEDLRSNTILHSRFGFACVRRDMETFKQYPTVPMQAIRLAVQKSMLSEEMRILYVALTRAREKLIVTAAVKTDLTRKLKGLDNVPEDGKLSPYVVGEARGYADWILMSLLRHSCGVPLRERAGCEHLHLTDDGNPWVISIVEEFGEGAAEAEERRREFTAEVDPALMAQLEQQLAFRYPFAGQSTIPSKLAVSTVAKGKHDVAHRFAARPAFLTGEKLNAAEKGNALHKFMQFADYEAAARDTEAEIRRMGESRFLSRTETASLSADVIRRFFQSPLYRRISASPRVWRELKFMAAFGKEELGGHLEGMDDTGKVVLNGVADCVFLEDGKAVIVDYKTDRVKTPEELIERYAAQLTLYRRILEQSLETEVKACVLYSFALAEEIIVESE
ncbi:helicase-exonuclease AddAB subunit AddA [Ruminococcaceae bacterium OttesenSCG-928-L11]|nr:helicase-exonuclease AddAB subunit AddA [Ruminococcaceae bacterium OttesenSCG-928-L11]